MSELSSPKLVLKNTASINAKHSKIGVPGTGPQVNPIRQEPPTLTDDDCGDGDEKKNRT